MVSSTRDEVSAALQKTLPSSAPLNFWYEEVHVGRHGVANAESLWDVLALSDCLAVSCKLPGRNPP